MSAPALRALRGAIYEEAEWTTRPSTCRFGGFLKTLGVTAQREIAVREQVEAGELRGDETLDATATVAVRGLSRDLVVTGTIALS